jgi:DNA mismatch repair protein MutS
MKRFDDRKLKPKLTPMMQQWQQIKNQNPEYVLFFRAGDFYECFNEDAKIASDVLNITLTAKPVGERKIPLAGVPYHAVDSYIAKMVQSGYKVAIVEQLEDPKTAKKVVKRGVVQLVTRGTITLPESLGKGQNNYLVGLAKEESILGISALDLSTGEFLVADFEKENALGLLEVELTRLNPSEILVENELWKFLDFYYDEQNCTITHRDDYYFDIEQGKKDLRETFEVLSLEGFGVDDHTPSIGAAGAILRYIKETQKREDFPNITKISQIRSQEFMTLDSSTIRNLELIENLRDRTSYGTLRQILDNTKNPIGSRLLISWILRPSLNPTTIQGRLDATEELFEDIILREEFRDILGKMSDLERITSRICLGRSTPRDLLALKNSLELIPEIQNNLSKFKTVLLKEIRKKLNPLKEVTCIIKTGIADEVPTSVKDGGVIRDGYNQELDELRTIQRSGKSFLSTLEAREKANTGIKNLKVRYNKVFGYYIEVPKASTNKVPAGYERKQTLVNAERYITPELKEYEEKILNAEEKILILEEELFSNILKEITQFASSIQQNAYYCAILDVITTFAQNAAYYNYVKPEITEEEIIDIKDGRHPVVEQLLEHSSFVPNDTIIRKENERILIITGPNMGGKCVTPDTLIFTEKGVLPIKTFKPEGIKEGSFEKLEVDLISTNSVAKTSHFYSDGIKNTIKITTRRGYSIEGSHNHPILVRTKKGLETWKKLSDIDSEDYIIINRKNDLWGTETKLKYSLKDYPHQVRKYPLPLVLEKDLAYLIGLLIGDGTLTYEDSYYLCTGDNFISNEFIRINKRLFNYDVKIKKNGKDHYVASKYLRGFLYLLGLKYKKSYEKEIPEIILKAPKKVIVAFLQGLFDADGTAGKKYGKVSLSTTSRKLATQIQIILLNFGIISSLKVRKTQKKPCFEVRITGIDSIKFYEYINFRLKRKKERSNLTSDLRMTNIDSIPYLNETLLEIKSRYLAKSKELLSGSKLKYNKKISAVYDSYMRQGRNISFFKLKELIKFFRKNNIDCNELEEIYERFYFYDKISKIEHSKSEVYDFSVPETHAFIGNGIVNHNSTILRQVALIVLMAQIGSFIPAKQAKIGLTDRIFTRIGAHDVLVEHRSTFMVEMYECANILNNATEKSLVILDEVGRGTSTFDGVAIAWSITEFLHNNIGKNGPRTLFATHYHELIELEELLPRVKNYHVSVKNIDGDIHFLYKVKEGGINESFGIHVASLAGLPEKVIDDANEMLSILHDQDDKKELQSFDKESILAPMRIEKSKEKQVKSSKHVEKTEEIMKDLSEISIEEIAPVDALNILNQLVKKSNKIMKEKGKNNKE